MRNYFHAKRWAGRRGPFRQDFVIGAVALAAGLLVFAGNSYAGESGQVVATVGSHKITEKELDTKIKPQMAKLQSQVYQIKERAIQSIADDYLLSQAAEKEKLSVDEYLKRHVEGDKVTEAQAKKYYDDHKDLQSRFPNFDQIKERLVQALENQRENQQRQALMDRLRKDEPVKMLLEPPRLNVKSAGHPELGSANAPVTMVEFGDFQCPFCKRAEPTLKQVREKYGDKVRLVYMDFPLPIHQHAMDAALGARCANDQGKFWAFHDELFEDQSKLAPKDLKESAKSLGLDTAKFDACLDKGKYRSQVEADLNQGSALGVDGTPAFFINGRPLTGAQPFSQFVSVIDEELVRSRETQAGSGEKQARAK